MDQYAANSSTSYSSLPSIAPQQLQQHAPLPPHTLPPLQAQHAAMSMHPLYGGQPLSAPHTPTTTTPNTPGSAGNTGFQQVGGQPGARGGYHLQAPYQQQPLQPYNSSSAMMPQTSASMQHPQAIAPAPGPPHNRLVPLRPMNATGPLQHGMPGQMPHGLASPYGQPAPGPEEPPTHVVGSQGRRGILPSAPGRPSVSQTGTGATKNALIPAKDADGKFPCPHCTKTYLHAKHLKRHLLRHTGDRPYMCVLCRDTFSRSDILKRHFQKCSIRRGNPTGASHLSHAQAHLKKSHPGPHKGSTAGQADMNGMSAMPNDANAQAAQEHLSRSNSLKRLSSGSVHDGGSMPGSAPPGSSRASFDQNYSGNIPSTMASNMNPQLAAFSMPNGHSNGNFSQNYHFAPQNNGPAMHASGNEGMAAMTNGREAMPMFAGAPNAQQSNVDWSQIFQPGAHNGFIGPYNSNLAQNQMAIKAEPSLAHPHGSLLTGMYSIAGVGQDGTGSLEHSFPRWHLAESQLDPLQQLSIRLTEFCCPSMAQNAPKINEIRTYLSASNIKHFLELFTNFQGHFPVIHPPTFRITDAYHGLILAMVCIGAVYSDRLNSSQVRDLMEQARAVNEKHSQLHQTLIRNVGETSIIVPEVIIGGKSHLEEIQAFLLMHLIFTWHGTPIQREVARRRYPALVKMAQAARLTELSIDPQSFSLLHQPDVHIQNLSLDDFNWSNWVAQETRSRLFHILYLLDSAMVLYFNNPPQWNAYDISLPLPADDAAWYARTSEQCAEALGLHGPEIANERNPDGSRLLRQLEMNSALKALADPNAPLAIVSTNVYSKFILVHALHVQVWLTQMQFTRETELAVTNQGSSSIANGSTTLSSQVFDHSGYSSNNTSRDQSPVDIGSFQEAIITINRSLQNWKKAWDEDMVVQYPPSSTSYRRFGFCRDGVHFFYLAKYIMGHFKKHRRDWQMAPDQRFVLIMQMLKSVKAWVISDNAKKGEELGSVGDIDQAYGFKDLTLDMAQLFKPINEQIDSPVRGVETHADGQ